MREQMFRGDLPVDGVEMFVHLLGFRIDSL
jgi:hypothetical protein